MINRNVSGKCYPSIKVFLSKLHKDVKGGSLIEYGICIAVAVYVLYLIISSIDQIILWMNNNVNDLIASFSF